jgi:hypothetical protein
MKTTATKVFVIIAIAIIGTGIFGVIHFVSQFSSTYPPIREYSYASEVDLLERLILEVINEDSTITYKKTDTVGGINNNYAYYMDISIEDNNDKFKYVIKYGNYDNSDGSYIKLIGAFDPRNNTGGYKLENEGVTELTELFEQRIINVLEKKAHNTVYSN